ncbi:unnamed protein product [Linum trigynum]|uniref:RNA-directed DNA polymerase n=1 Tax=Linum trigynum TaxID=586398 RepID=A0AAV2GR79_9ROSI
MAELRDLVGSLATSSANKFNNIEQFMEKASGKFLELEAGQRNTQAVLRDIQTQLGSVAQAVAQRTPGTLPGQTIPHPQDPNANCSAITTRSGKVTADLPVRAEERETPASALLANQEDMEKEVEVYAPISQPVVKEYVPQLPFPTRLHKDRLETEFAKFMAMLKQVNISMHFVEALSKMPKYAKFMKDLLTNKRKLGELSTVMLNEECSAILQNKLPEKRKDPGSFTIPCMIGSLHIGKSLADLGASINVMPYKLFKKLGLGEPSDTRMSIQLADRSIVHPRGIAEDLIVAVGPFSYPADFVILDINEDVDVPLILGRPFLATAKALIDVNDGKLILRAGGEQITFSVSDNMKHPQLHDDLDYCDVVADFETALAITSAGTDDFLERCLLLGKQASQDVQLEEQLAELDEAMIEGREIPFKPIPISPRLATSLEEPPELELKPLPSHLEYAFLREGNKLPVIISSDLTPEQKSGLVALLQKYARAMAWKITDIGGISPSFCSHRILMEDEVKPFRQPQRRLSPNLEAVVRAEIVKLMDAGIIFAISDSKWVSPTQVVSKKGGMTVVPNEKKELIPMRTVTGWRVCIDYRRLNDATKKDHFPLPFIDQMLERLAGHEFYCFLDGMSSYFQIPIAPEDQAKTTFTCPFGTFAYRRIPFGLCNAPATFQRCMLAIFDRLVGEIMEVFMDDFSVYGDSFSHCLHNLELVLKRCEETNLALSWEKCHFMVREGIVLGHKISKQGIEVDRAKIETISKLPPPISVKGIRSFLGHAGFYRRFIKDFSKIALPLTKLLEKDAPFQFTPECTAAFETLKEKLTHAPIMVTPDWSLPFELMCDASDYAAGAVLGQRREKHFQPIYYASKTLNDAQENYTTTEKELLAVVYAFDKFRPYLVLSHVVVYTDHSAIRYLMSKADAKPRLIRWILLLQEFDIEIRDKKGAENVAADHLSWLEASPVDNFVEEIDDSFPGERLLAMTLVDSVTPWYSDFANYLVGKQLPKGMATHAKRKFFYDLKHYFWEDPFLFRIGADGVIRRCVMEHKMGDILSQCHEGPTGGHHGGNRTARKVVQSGFYWPSLFKDADSFARQCDRC